MDKMPYNGFKKLVLVQPTYDTKGSIFELQISFSGKSDKRSITCETLEADEPVEENFTLVSVSYL